MSARLITAIKMSETARAVLRKTQSFPKNDLAGHEGWEDPRGIGVEPMLLALSMELALKAWFVFDFIDPKPAKYHHLAKLLDKLKPDSQEKLDAEFKKKTPRNIPGDCTSITVFVTYCIRTRMRSPIGATFMN